MGVVVQKYGGSSVADVEKIRAVARRVVATREAGHPVVVVVSAMGNTTNELLQLARSVAAAPGRRELDMLISVGERISMTLLSMAVTELGAPAVSFTGSQSGIITDEKHSAARIVEVRPHRIREALDEGKVVIVAGFQGVSRDREVTTLGRGGTDLTAVALAASLGADWCEICSDVDGVYSADPRRVPEARRLDTLSLDEALALARAGARVLQADAVALAHRMGIELNAAHMEQPPGSGTRIQVASLPQRIAAVTVDTQLERFEGPDTAALLESLAGTGAGIRRVDGGVLVDLRNWHDRAAYALPPGVTSRAVAEVSAAGTEALASPELALAGLRALQAGGVEILGWTATAQALSWLVPPDQADPAQRLVHAALL